MAKRFCLQAIMRRITVLIGAALVCQGACSSSEGKSSAKLAEGCLINSDCSSPLVCAFRRCHVQCTTSRDCSTGERCAASDRPFHVCQLADETKCTRNSDCPETMICASDLECRDQCATSRDCVPEQMCVSSACADPVDIVDGGLRAPEGGTDAGTGSDPTGTPCSYNSQCGDGLICVAGACRYECLTDVDCSAGALCESHRCVATGTGGTGGTVGTGGVGTGGTVGTGGVGTGGVGTGGVGTGGVGTGGVGTGGVGTGGTAGADAGSDASVGCFYNSDCTGAGVGYICHNGHCIPQCREDIDCPLGQSCVSGSCRTEVPDGSPPGYGALCALNSDCAPGLVCQRSGFCG
jgi:hypothetical protein